MKLRAYQKRIVEAVKFANSVVVLPTGAGKTLIAAESILGESRMSLFLVPTILLVEQQAREIRSWIESSSSSSRVVAEYFGGTAFPLSAIRNSPTGVLVSTPKAFSIAQSNNPDLLGWQQFSLVVFDEVHHVIKDHPYRKIAQHMRRHSQESSGVRILGLTASISYAVTESAIKKSIGQLCNELQITTIEQASKEELIASGYHASDIQAEIRKVEDLPRFKLPLKVVPPSDRKPHLLLPMFWQRERSAQLTNLAKDLFLIIVEIIEPAVGQADPTFESPLRAVKQLAKWGEYASRKRMQSRGPNASLIVPLYTLLENWYEALRLLIISWEENQEGVLMFLKMMGADTCSIISVRDAIESFFQIHDTGEFLRFAELKDVLLHKKEEKGESFRGILFVQQRVTTHILQHFISQDADLKRALGGPPVVLYATSSPATPSLSISKV